MGLILTEEILKKSYREIENLVKKDKLYTKDIEFLKRKATGYCDLLIRLYEGIMNGEVTIDKGEKTIYIPINLSREFLKMKGGNK